MSSSKLKLTLVLGALTWMAGLSAPANAALDLAQKPLYLGTSIKPSFIMALDDSGSMQWDILSANQDGELVWGRDTAGGTDWGFFRNDGSLRQDATNQGSDRLGDWLELFPIASRGTRRNTVPPTPHFGFARSPEFNPGYYDPAVEFGPWKNFDGTLFESFDTDAEWKSMKVDPRATDARRYDLTATILDRSDDGITNDTVTFDNVSLVSGDVLRTGWQVRNVENSTQTCSTTSGNLTLPASSSSVTTLTADRTLTANCATVRVVKRHADNPTSVTGTNGENFRVREGMIIPAGTSYMIGTADCGGFGGSFNRRGEWTTLAADLTVTADCRVAMGYYAPTYYLTTPTSPDGNTSPTLFNALPGGPRATTEPGLGRLYRYEIRPGNYASYAQYERAMTNFANWFAYYRTRNLALVAALTRSLNDVDFMRIGYFLINDTSNGTDYTATVPPVVMHEMSDFTDSASVAGRKRLYEGLLNLPANGSTPNAWAVNQMGLQFARTSGTTSPASDPPITNVCQFNAGMLFTDGYHNQGRPTTFGNVDNQSPFHGVAPFTDTHQNSLADIAAYYYRTNPRPDLTAGLVPVPPGCAAATPDPRLDCNRNLHMNFYGITLGAAGEYFGVTHQQNPDTFQITPDVFTAGNAPAWKGWANDSRSSVDDLWHATLNARGQYINATSPERVSRAMNAIIESINNSARRSAGTAASGARRTVGFTAYVPEFDPNSWTGDVKAYTVKSDGTLSDAVWSAVEKLPAPADRKILLSRRKADNSGYELVPFVSTNLGTTEAERRAAVGLGAADFGSTGTFRDRTMTQVVDFLRGDKTREGNAPGQFRSRLLRNVDGTEQHRPIGDILGSQPEVLSRAALRYARLPRELGGRFYTDDDGIRRLVPADQPGTYSQFVNTTKATRTPVLMVGSNAGMIHGFNAAPDGDDRGKEVFAVVPDSVLGKMGELARRDYEHTYFADGSPRVTDACVGAAAGQANCSWKTVLLSGMGSGARGVIALDVTNPASSFTASNLLWELNSKQDADIGFVVNAPRVFIGEDKEWYAAFGNGLNSASHRAYVFVVRLKTGEVVRKFALGTDGSAADPNGAVAVIAVDGDGNPPGDDPTEENELSDTLYATDFHGRLWKLDLSSGNPTEWSIDLGGPLYTAIAVDTAERADRRQFVTGSLEVARHPVRGNLVMFGTGRYIADGDQNVAATPQVQTFYAIWDDPNQAAGFSGRANLQVQTITGETTVGGVDQRRVSTNPVNYTQGADIKRGWYIDLYRAGVGGFRGGERVLGEPTVLGGLVVFTAFQPIGSECNPGGKNWLYALSVATGAPALNLPGCPDCAGTDLNPEGTSAPPTLAPPIVIDPTRPRDPDDDDDDDDDSGDSGDGDADGGDAGGGGPGGKWRRCLPGTPNCRGLPGDGSALPGSQCVNRISVLLPNQLRAFSELSCGRQSWRQIQ